MVDDYLMSYYKKELRKTKILSAEEEQALCARIKQGDERAKNKLIEGSLKTVWCIAKRYYTSYVDLSDLIQEGNLGLIHAAEKFDLESGVRFNTYAIFWIRQYIQRFFHEKARLVRIPVDREVMFHKVSKLRDKYLSELGREPRVGEIAESLGKSEEFVSELIQDTMPCDSLDYADTNCADNMVQSYSYIGDMRHNPEVNCCNEGEKTLLEQAMKKLSERDREIIKMRFGFYDKEYTLAEASERYGIGIERCRQIQKAAIQQMAAFYTKVG